MILRETQGMCLLALLVEKDAGLCAQIRAQVQDLKCLHQTKDLGAHSFSLISVHLC